MKAVPNVMMIMQEIQSLKTVVLDLTTLVNKQTELLEMICLEEPEHTAEITYTEEHPKTIQNFDYKITALLQELRIPANIKGYFLLREAIKLALHDNGMMRVTKMLYPVLAQKFDTTPARAERAIRHAIERSYDKSYFHPIYQSAFLDAKPSNSQFIAMIVDKFRLEEDQMKLGPVAQL